MSFPMTYTPEPARPSGGPRKGTRVLYDFCIGTFDVAETGDDISGLGIYNPRDVCGNQWPNWRCTGSQHARGAAGDCGVPVDRQRWPKGHPEGWRLARWLVRHHVALGVQEVIFAGWRWTNQTLEWRPYSGRSDHFDHVHWAQNDAGADGLTIDMILAVWREEEDMPLNKDDLAAIRALLDEAAAPGTIGFAGTVQAQLDVARDTRNLAAATLARVTALPQVTVEINEDQLVALMVDAVAGMEDRTARKVLDGLRDRLAA